MPPRLPDVAERLWWLSGVLLAICGVAVAAMFSPIPGDPGHLDLFGHRLGPSCTLLLVTGLPCPSCGMTRAWVSVVHGDLSAALRYNVAGAVLLAAVLLNAAYGAWRLAGGRPRPWMSPVAIGLAIGWLVLFAGTWVVRLAGAYPLP